MLKKSVVALSILPIMFSSTIAFAAGNGNDGCFVPGYEDSHKDHGQSNEHKIQIGYLDFEKEMAGKGVTIVRMSNNVDSNGWITYHVLDEEGKQIEVVKVRGQEEEVLPPVLDGSEDDNMMVEPPIGDGSEEDNFLNPNLPVGEGEDNMEVEPPILEGEDDFLIDQPATDEDGFLPEIGVEPPVLEGEDDYLTPNLPVGEGEDDMEVEFEDYPVLEGEDNMMVEPPIEDSDNEDNFLTPNLPVEPDNKTDLPVTGLGSASLLLGTGSTLFGALALVFRKRK